MDGYERYDEDVAAFWDRVGDAGTGRLGFALRHPVATWTGLREVRRLPRLHYEPGTGPGARALLATLRRRQLTRHDFALFGAAVLAIPADPAVLLQGRRQQTMRRMLRKAERAGLTCRAVQPHERLALLKRANAMEQQHRLDTYRVAEPANDDLLDHPLWRVCELQGRPVLLSVTPVDGSWSCLRYFRTLGASEHHTLARWLSTYDLATQLSARGVRHLLDTEAPAVQTNGVRHFQRMLGFRYAVVTRPVARGWRLARPVPAPPPGTTAPAERSDQSRDTRADHQPSALPAPR